jgi:hypothetical protein
MRAHTIFSKKEVFGEPKRPFFVCLLQGSGAEDRRRTLTPLALRYSILSESPLGMNLFLMLFPLREGAGELLSLHW